MWVCSWCMLVRTELGGHVFKCHLLCMCAYAEYPWSSLRPDWVSCSLSKGLYPVLPLTRLASRSHRCYAWTMVIEVVASFLCYIVGYQNSSKGWYWASCFVGKLSILARLFYPSLQLPKVLATLAFLSWAVMRLLVSCCG